MGNAGFTFLFLDDITYAVFQGSILLVPALFILHIFKVRLSVLSQPSLLIAANLAVLLATELQILIFLEYLFFAYYSATGYMSFAWNAVEFLFLLFIVIIPQLFWFKKFRRSVWWGLFAIAYYVVKELSSVIRHSLSEKELSAQGWHTSSNFYNNLRSVAIYVLIIVVIYWLTERRKARSSVSINTAP